MLRTFCKSSLITKVAILYSEKLTKNQTMTKENESILRFLSIAVIVFCGLLLLTHYYQDASKRFEGAMDITIESDYVPKPKPSSNISRPTAANSESGKNGNVNYRISQNSNSNSSLSPQIKEAIEILSKEVKRLNKQEGLTDEEALKKILREAGKIP